MRHLSLGIAAFLILGLAVGAQDTESVDRGAELALKSLKQAGGLVLEGRLSRSNTLGEMGAMFGDPGSRPVEGKFTATIGSNDVNQISVKSGGARVEIYWSGETRVHRITFAGDRTPAVPSFAREVTRILDFQNLSGLLKKSKGAKLEKGEKYRTVKVNLSGHFLEQDEPEGEEDAMVQMMSPFEIDKVEATFLVDENDHLHRLSLKVVRKFNEQVQQQFGGGSGEEGEEEEEQEEEEGPGGMPQFDMEGARFTNSWTFTIKKRDRDLKVKLPSDLNEFFEE